MTKEKKFSEKVWGNLEDRLKNHPGLIFSIGYLIWVTVGIFYLTIFYSEFDIPILKLLEVTDILLAGFQEPYVSIALVIAIFLTVILIYGTDWYSVIRKKYNHWQGKRYGPILRFITYIPKNVSVWRWMFVAFLLLYFSLFLEIFVAMEHKKIRNNDSTFYTLQQNGELVRANCDVGTTERWQLLGSTTKFLFLRSSECNYSMVVGIENVEQIAQIKTNERSTSLDKRPIWQKVIDWFKNL